MKKSTLIIIGVILFLAFISLMSAVLIYSVFSRTGGQSASYSSGVSKIAVIHISGVITSGSTEGGLFSSPKGSAERVIKYLEKARKDNSVKVVILRINSPGGTAAGSKEIYDAVMKLRKSGKIVIASLADVAASGGYYVAAACDKIVSSPATVTGSIGVIMKLQNMQKLFKTIGVDSKSIKSGKHKDIGSFSREMTKEEEEILQGLIDDVFDQFVTDVSLGRKMDKEEVKKLADGRIYTGRQAKQLKLVDELGGLQDAIQIAADLAKIKGEPKVIIYGRVGFYEALFGGEDDQHGSGGKLEALVFVVKKLMVDSNKQEKFELLKLPF